MSLPAPGTPHSLAYMNTNNKKGKHKSRQQSKQNISHITTSEMHIKSKTPNIPAQSQNLSINSISKNVTVKFQKNIATIV